MSIKVKYTDGTVVEFSTVDEWARYAAKYRHRIHQTEDGPTTLIKSKRKKEGKSQTKKRKKVTVEDVGMEATINRAVKRKRGDE